MKKNNSRTMLETFIHTRTQKVLVDLLRHGIMNLTSIYLGIDLGKVNGLV